jgi:hypothetical protein
LGNVWKAVLFASLVVSLSLVQSASGHALFNSAEETIGDTRIQIATDPEIPEPNKKSKILMRVTDLDLNEVPRFTVGIRIFYDDVQVDGIAPQTIDGGHWEFDYVFQRPGNHIFRVDLYDDAGKIRTFTFNMGTQNPFGYIFIYVIASGAIGAAVLFIYIYVPKRLKRSRL